MIELKSKFLDVEHHPLEKFVMDEICDGRLRINVIPRPDLSDAMFVYNFTVTWNEYSHSGTYSMGMAYKTVTRGMWQDKILWPDDESYHRFTKPAPKDVVRQFDRCSNISDIEHAIAHYKGVIGVAVKVALPDPTDLIWSLIMDADVVDRFEDAWEMQECFGVEPRKAEGLYQACVATYRFLHKATDYEALQEVAQDY